MRTILSAALISLSFITGCSPSSEKAETGLSATPAVLLATAGEDPPPAKAQEPSASERARIIAMAENMRTKDGSTIGMVLRDVERLRPKKFKLVNGFDLNYSFDGRLSGVSVCYWIGEKRTDDDAYCDLGYRLSADKTSLEHEYDSLSQDEIDALTLTALEFGKESFLRHVDRRYQTRDTTTIIENGAAIQALLAQIPAMSMEVGRMTLAERLASLGVSVRFVFTGHLSLEEVTSSEGLYKTGDELFVFHTSEHPAGASDGCPIVSSVSFIKRGKSWLPQSKTANYYAFGSCKAPG